MQRIFLAIDIGASSGRHIVGIEADGALQTDEVYRFPNGVQRENGHLIWDIEGIFQHVKAGIKAAFAKYPHIDSLSIDTWAVDYVLLKDGAALDSLSGEYDIHGDNGAHCYIGYRHSLCHGWSSAPAAFLAERVLGIRLLEPGCRRIGIYPELGGLEWAEGEYPTPYGTVSVKCRKTGDGKISVEYKAPEQIEIEIGSGVSM